MLRKSLLLFTLIFILAGSSYGLYNDVGNDSCLTIYSDSYIYRPNNLLKPNTIEVTLTIENKCGEIVTANLGILTEKKHTALISIKKAQSIIDKDAKDGKDAKDITNKATSNTLPYLKAAKQFETKQGWESFIFVDGNTQLLLEMEVPFEEGEFAITAFNPLNPIQHSTLDPTYLGSGSLLNPYIITTCIELQDINYHLNDASVYFELGNDLDCSSGNLDRIGYEGGTTEFKGHLDGQYHFIRNLTINAPFDNFGTGLFGKSTGAKISKLGLIDATISNGGGNERTGVLVGYAEDCNFSEVFIYGGSLGAGRYSGGVVGFEGGSDYHDIYSANITLSNGTANDIGGLAAYMGGSHVVENSYSTAKIISSGSYQGALAGRGTATTTSSYWNPTDSGVATSVIGTESTQANMKKQATYSGWDFVNVWGIVEDTNTPYLRGFYPPSNSAPAMTSIDLNATYSKQNDDIKVTASGVADAQSDNLTLLCGTSANPTIDSNNFCTAFNIASPYTTVSCVGKGASGDGSKTVYCRMYDGALYSIDQNTDTYIADNTAPSVSSVIINNGSNLEGINYDLNMAITDGGSGLYGTPTYKCWNAASSEGACASNSWDCKTGNLTNNGSNNYGAAITGSIKDTNGMWTCKGYATDAVGLQGTGTDTESMNETTGFVIDSSSLSYSGIAGSTCNTATTNQTNPYILITHNGNVDLNVLNLCNALTYSSYSIAKENHKWLLSNSCGGATACNGLNQILTGVWGRGTYPTNAVMNLYYWLDIPVGQQIGEYSGTITIGAAKSG